MSRRSKCPSCNVTTYVKNKPFTCAKCGWKTIIEQDEKGKDIQIN
jgi:ssDNA-binding Zn-finger/Zn-ribbon topoisomerase 1